MNRGTERGEVTFALQPRHPQHRNVLDCLQEPEFRACAADPTISAS